jgi:hypothetical protein
MLSASTSPKFYSPKFRNWPNLSPRMTSACLYPQVHDFLIRCFILHTVNIIFWSQVVKSYIIEKLQGNVLIWNVYLSRFFCMFKFWTLFWMLTNFKDIQKGSQSFLFLWWVFYLKHRIRKSCTWRYKHALVILGLKLGQFRNLGG